ncbi:MAG: hypothetical protein A2170_02730 [Deltaproteobacteria bacterium RBG_13_53_10]|nr:MAG: hypothetical protein A2170_02730 [Deltaproteobacteria bacterium RBG_13_53_10]
MQKMSYLLSDTILFPALQVALVMLVLFAALRNWLQARKAGRGGVTLAVTRGDVSMGRFYGMYAATSGLLVAICLSVDAAKNHRVLWVAIDTTLVAYVCLLNPWFRNLLLGWSARLSKIEKR